MPPSPPSRPRLPRLKSFLTVAGTLAVVAFLAAIGFGVRAGQRAEEATRVLAAVESVPRRAPNAWVRTTLPRPDAPRDERLAAGERLEAETGALIPQIPEGLTTTTEREVQGAAGDDPQLDRFLLFHLEGPESPLAMAWREVLANATDERLPEPPAELVSWLDDHETETMRLARLVLDSPTLAWEREPRDWEPASQEANLLAGTLTLGAGVDAWRGRHAAAAEKLEAAWALRVALAEARPTPELPQVLLGALRCTRVPNPGEWIERLQAIDLRGLIAQHRIWSAKQRLESTAAEAEEEVPPGLPDAMKTVAVGLVKLPDDWEASVRVAHAAATVQAIESLAPCDDPGSSVTPKWKHLHALSDFLPTRSALTTAYALVVLEQDEAVHALKMQVLALRGGLDVADPCDRVTTERAPDGRTIARCTPEPHPLASELGLWGARSFTLSSAVEPVIASAPDPPHASASTPSPDPAAASASASLPAAAPLSR